VYCCSGVVSAEIDKARGDTLVLALAPGQYDVDWRHDGQHERCGERLVEGERREFDPTDCIDVPIAVTAAKGPAEDARVERWGLELGVGSFNPKSDAYVQTLDDFGFARQEALFGPATAHLSLAWTPLRNLAVVGTLGTLDSGSFSREMSDPDGLEYDTEFMWSTSRFGVYARGQLPLWNGWLVPYAQAGGGPAWASTTFEDQDGPTAESFFGGHLAAAGGLQVEPVVGRQQWRHVGIFGQAELSTAPVVDNLVGDTHDSGGLAVTFGLRASL